MQDILEMIDKGVLVIDEQGRVQYANHHFIGTEWDTEEKIEGQNIDQLFTQSLDGRDILSMITSHIGKSFKTMGNKGKMAGRVISCHVLKEMWKGVQSYLLFIENSIFRAEEYMKYLLDEIPYTLWVKSKKGKFAFVNSRFVKMLREQGKIVTRSDILEKDDKAIWDKEIYEPLKEAEDKVKHIKTSVNCEISIIKEGRERWYIFSLTPILDQSGEVEFIVESMEESTVYKQIEAAMEENYAESHQYIGCGEEDHQFDCLRNAKEINEIKSEIRQALGADSLIIGMLSETQTQVAVICKDGGAVEDFRDINVFRRMDKWQRAGQEKWGLLTEEMLLTYLDEKITSKIKGKYKYFCIYPIYSMHKLMGILGAAYVNEKPDMGAQTTWISGVCTHLTILIKNKILADTVKEGMCEKENKEKEMQSAINLSADVIAIISNDGTILKINNLWKEQLGWSIEETIGTPFLNFVHPDEQDEILKAAKEKSRNKHYGMTKFMDKDGSSIWYEYQMQYKPEIDKVVMTARNITEKMQYEQENKAHQQAETIANITSEFFTNMSHEFRTPINIILSSVQLLCMIQEQEKQISTEEFKRYTQKIKLNSYRLLRLANNLIDVTRMDAGDIEFERENINIVRVVKSIVKTVNDFVRDKGIILEFETISDEIIIACDIDKIERVILNLISNSIKNRRKDLTAVIKIKIDVKNECVMIYVTNNGECIPREKVGLIFQRFIQVDSSLNRAAEGCGVGLTLAKEYVEMHHGTITVESDKEHGTVFTIKLPLIRIAGQGVQRREFKCKMDQCLVELSDIYF